MAIHGIVDGYCFDLRDGANPVFVSMMIAVNNVFFFFIPSVTTLALNIAIISKIKNRKATTRWVLFTLPTLECLYRNYEWWTWKESLPYHSPWTKTQISKQDFLGWKSRCSQRKNRIWKTKKDASLPERCQNYHLIQEWNSYSVTSSKQSISSETLPKSGKTNRFNRKSDF